MMGDAEKLLDMLRTQQLEHAEKINRLVAVNAVLLEAVHSGIYRLKQYDYQAMGRTIEKMEQAIARATGKEQK